MEGDNDPPLLLSELQSPETLLVTCVDGGANEAAQVTQQDQLQLISSLELQAHLEDELDYKEEATWLLDDSVVVAGEGEGDTTTLILLNDPISLLPISSNSLQQAEVGVSEVVEDCLSSPSKYQLSILDCPLLETPCTVSSQPAASTSLTPSITPSPLSSSAASSLSQAVIESNAVKLKFSTTSERSSTPLLLPTSVIPSVTEFTKQEEEEGAFACDMRGKSGKVKLTTLSKWSVDEDELSEEPFVGPSVRWPSQPRSYRGAKLREASSALRKTTRKSPQRPDTDGETSGMGSSVDEPVESSTESASEAPALPSTFLQPRPSMSRAPSTSPTAIKKRRGGWPKGRKRKPELPGAKPPKAPLTAYVLFLNERRKYYKETQPDLSFGAVTKLLGAEWSNMTTEQKAAFVSRSEQDKRRYRNELQAYRQSHDYQLLLRKKRIKNVIRRGGTTTEESSDFTDEIDDDDSEELYCRICDQLFSSLHNKREHLYGKQHLRAITGEYQRERLAEEERQKASAVRVGRGAADCLTCGTLNTQPSPRTGVHGGEGGCPACSPPTQPPQPCDEDHDGDEEDEQEEDEDEEHQKQKKEEEQVEEEESEGEEEEEEEAATTPVMCGSVTSALEGVMARVVEREAEIAALKQSSEAARATNLALASTLLHLREEKVALSQQVHLLQEENEQLKAEADTLWMLPALFGVTPLQMVDITLRQDQQLSPTLP